MSARDVPALLFCVWCVGALHQPDARGDAEGGCYRHEYGDGEVDDFLPKFFLAHGFNGCLVDAFF